MHLFANERWTQDNAPLALWALLCQELGATKRSGLRPTIRQPPLGRTEHRPICSLPHSDIILHLVRLPIIIALIANIKEVWLLHPPLSPPIPPLTESVAPRGSDARPAVTPYSWESGRALTHEAPTCMFLRGASARKRRKDQGAPSNSFTNAAGWAKGRYFVLAYALTTRRIVR
jgi:hypothetical protein